MCINALPLVGKGSKNLMALAAAALAAVASASGGPDCAPCDRSPWRPVMPMGRALRAHQVALTIPTIQLTLPIAQVRPPPIPSSESLRGSAPPSRGQYGGPLLDGSQFGLPPPPLPQRFSMPFNTYGAPQSEYDSASNPTEQKYILHPQQEQSLVGVNTNSSPANQKHPALNSGHNDQTKDQLPSTSDTNPFELNKPPTSPKPQPLIKSQSTPQQINHPQSSQFTSIIGLKSSPTAQKYFPPPNYQLLPSVKYGPPFDTKAPPRNNHFFKFETPPHQGVRPVNLRPQQYHDDNIKQSLFIQSLRPIAFPTASKTQLPPLFGYQQFNSGQNNQPRPYLEPPKPQNVVFTIVESDDVCKQCQENAQHSQNQPQKDSDTAQAEHVTESVLHTTQSLEINPKESTNFNVQKQSVQIVKSVPLSEYLASVEYPMQIVQAPILDVPDLTKYFNLGYSSPLKHQYHDGSNLNYQNPSPTYIYPNKQNSVFESQGLRGQFTDLKQTSQAALDNIELLDSDTGTTNILPHNHKLNHDLEKNHLSTEKTTTIHSPFSQPPSSYSTVFSTRPSQIFHISKASPLTQPTHTTALPTSTESSTTTSHYLSSQSLKESITEQQLPNPASPPPFIDPLNPALEDQSAGSAKDSNPSDSSHLRFINPPPLGTGAISDWSLPSFGRGWGNLPPKPFTVPGSNYRPRFSARPSPIPAKKAKHIHQIIIPYTTNKQAPIIVQEPTNHIGWTPVPPTNQGRKVPSNAIYDNQLALNTGFDTIPSGGDTVGKSKTTLPIDSAKNTKIESIGASQHILSTKGPTFDLPPHVINQILQLNKQGTSGTEPTSLPSGPDELQQLLVTNLQGLLRGEEDSIDFTRLQKNIDNWTAEGYKQNSPPVHFVPVTTTSHIFNSKKIPEEYLTTEPTTINPSSQEVPRNHQHFYSDHEGAASQRHQVKVPPTNFGEIELQDTTEYIETLINGWSLLDSKVTTQPPSSSSTEAWEKSQVSISPLTMEKVYVVTPEPTSEVNTTPSSQD